MSEWVNGWMSEWVKEWMGEGVNRWMKEWVKERMKEGSESMNDGIMEWIYFEVGHPVLVMAD